jgi:nitroreductase
MQTTLENPLTQTATLKTIYERRAVRKYRPQPVDEETIYTILNAGRMAPSAMNKQPWNFYVLTNADMIHRFSKEISKVAVRDVAQSGLGHIIEVVADLLHTAPINNIAGYSDPIFYKAPVVIFITAPFNNEWAALDVGMCAQNIMLAAKSLGLDSCPIGLAKYVEHTPSFSYLQVPPTEQVHLAIVVGFGNETPAVHERIENNAIFLH